MNLKGSRQKAIQIADEINQGMSEKLSGDPDVRVKLKKLLDVVYKPHIIMSCVLSDSLFFLSTDVIAEVSSIGDEALKNAGKL